MTALPPLPSLRSYARTAFAFAWALAACNATPRSSEQAKDSTPSGSKRHNDKVDAKTAEPPKKKPRAKQKKAPRECCLYCVSGTPCGDKCTDAGDSCTVQEPGCACPGSQRKPPKFKKGGKARKGLIAADVPAYNKAQGDPIDGNFGLAQAFAGDERLADTDAGQLYAILHTDMGKITCKLFEKETPATVANFVGLARGTRPVLDPKTKKWESGKKFYDGVLFHRVIEGFMLQTGDPTGTGTGGPGFFVLDEFDPSLRHDTPGLLSMANRNPVDPKTQKLFVDKKTGQSKGNTGSSQFFVTVAKTPHLDNRHAVFGKCDTKVATKISKVSVTTNRLLRLDHKPSKDVHLKSVIIERRKR
ncbi:MAG: peptidylprolyl isomerase [Nannocystaceae bacterium]